MSASNYAETKITDALCGNATFTAPTNVYIKLHVGDPGEDCTNNAAGNTTRQEATFNNASGPTASLAATVSWTNVSTEETYSHFSQWDNSTAGNPLCYGPLTAPVAVSIGDNFDLTALTVTTS